jgi:hypothetical protein
MDDHADNVEDQGQEQDANQKYRSIACIDVDGLRILKKFTDRIYCENCNHKDAIYGWSNIRDIRFLDKLCN